MSSPLRIIVTGLVGQYPVGGVAWDYLQYVVGLSDLGHEVFYYEDTWTWPFHPEKGEPVPDGIHSARFLSRFFKRYAPDLVSRWRYVHLHSSGFGMSRQSFDEVARSADVLLNVSGGGFLPDELSPDCLKIFLDTDPGYNQILLEERPAWSENVERWCETVLAHDRFFTYAENMGAPACSVPNAGLQWQTTRMPIVTRLWEPLANEEPAPSAPWTTVMTWNDFKGPLTHGGREFFSKNVEFEKLIRLPSESGQQLAVALGGRGAPRERLVKAGWTVLDGPRSTATPAAYQRFIGGSRGELSVAKNVYVATTSGWFSCRSACYLASGRPVVVQDTGFSRLYPVGEGLVAFNSSEGALHGLVDVEYRYANHRKRARELAGDLFAAKSVLSRMLEDASRSE